MSLPENNARLKQAGEGETEKALMRSAHMAWILGLSVIGIAGVYFAALYLLAR
jgi:hypothetical protein